jgi:hypothetical protein
MQFDLHPLTSNFGLRRNSLNYLQETACCAGRAILQRPLFETAGVVRSPAEGGIKPADPKRGLEAVFVSLLGEYSSKVRPVPAATASAMASPSPALSPTRGSIPCHPKRARDERRNQSRHPC